ncbi:M20 metallopeptidase family protein [Streptomyces longhuiensis]|uniref:M20 metallopeptidase family protein n=1 Tax=Streptomyces longhuiensis TaxID=2880933 RepID=UPI001D0A41E4|nr:M20 family metallopeptidase [Streptomyces longhuiensis]UDM00516.1 M20 family metallopeptidase [Streptomyces longhuiensis]
MTLRDEAQALLPELTELRHGLHREPEIGLQLPRTREKVLAALDGLPLEIHEGKGLSSITAVLRGSRPGPAVLLRGDMDALPLQELADVPYASVVDGSMHACGHDLHTAMLVGAAKLLSARALELAGSVVFMFQPGEEGCDGAGAMLAEGLLDVAGVPVIAAYATHVHTNLPAGLVVSRPGTATVAGSAIHIVLRGRGGHGSMPHQAADPVPAAAEIVTALQSMVTRTTDAFDPVVLSVGVLRAGTAVNIIPDSAEIGMTLRTCSDHMQEEVLGRIRRLCEHIALAHGLTAEVEMEWGFPATVNDADEVAFAESVTAELFGADHWLTAPQPTMASEDFSRILAVVPGAFLLLGACPPGTADPASAVPNHSPHARFDDSALPVGAALLAGLAQARLDRAGR